MQISSISANVAFGRISNSARIHQLEQKRAEIQWASEGCTGDLNPEDGYELKARTRLAELRAKEANAAWMSEGYNCTLCQEEMVEMAKLENIVAGFDAKLEELPKKAMVVERNIYDMPTRNLYDMPTKNSYGVPDHDFSGPAWN